MSVDEDLDGLQAALAHCQDLGSRESVRDASDPGVSGWSAAQHLYHGDDAARLARLAAIAERANASLVATNDVHYVNQEDADAQDVMLCINTGRFRTDTTRMKMDGQEYYLRSQEEMYRSFDGLEEAVSRTQEIADSVDIDLKLGERHFPSFKPPKELSSMEYLRQLCLEGLRERYAGNEERLTEGELTSQVMERLEHELDVIDQLGFSDYFLICWDFVRQARDSGIPATARGSGVGALVCYALYLSHVCPLKFGLLFERFLDVSRREAPDIDIDFCKEHRGEIIRYVKQKYGEANVAQIGTFGTLAARAAIKDTGRVLGIPLSRVNQLTGMIPNELGISLEGALERSDELAGEYKTDGEVRELLDVAMKIEGLARNLGTHAAAVVIGDKPLKEYLPLGKVTGKDDVITQWSMNDVEAAGLLKMDFLGLRNLTILRRSVDLVEQTLTDEGIRELSQIRQLETLGLDATPIQDRQLPHLFPLQNLQTLWLSHSKITDKGLRQLEQMKQLKRVYVQGLDVSAETADWFKKTLPECRLYR